MNLNYYLPFTEILTDKGFIQIQCLNDYYDLKIGLVDSNGVLLFNKFDSSGLTSVRYSGNIINLAAEDYNFFFHPGTNLIQNSIFTTNEFKSINILDIDTKIINNVLINSIVKKEGAIDTVTLDHLLLLDKFIKEEQDLSWIYGLDISSKFATDLIKILANLLDEEIDEYGTLLHLGISEINANALQYICCISGSFSSYVTIFDIEKDLFLIKILNNVYPINTYNLKIKEQEFLFSNHIVYSLNTENQMIIIRQNGSLLLSSNF